MEADSWVLKNNTLVISIFAFLFAFFELELLIGQMNLSKMNSSKLSEWYVPRELSYWDMIWIFAKACLKDD